MIVDEWETMNNSVFLAHYTLHDFDGRKYAM